MVDYSKYDRYKVMYLNMDDYTIAKQLKEYYKVAAWQDALRMLMREKVSRLKQD